MTCRGAQMWRSRSTGVGAVGRRGVYVAPRRGVPSQLGNVFVCVIVV